MPTCLTGLPETGLQRETPPPLLEYKGKDFLHGLFWEVRFMLGMGLILKITYFNERPSNDLVRDPSTC